MINNPYIFVQQNLLIGILILILSSCSETNVRPPDVGTKRLTPSMHTPSKQKLRESKTSRPLPLPSKNHGKRSEAFIEAEQIMEFHCMKYGNKNSSQNPEVSPEKECQKQMINYYRSCLKQHSKNDREVLACIKLKLRQKK